MTLAHIIRNASSTSESVDHIHALPSEKRRIGSSANILDERPELCRRKEDELAIKNVQVEDFDRSRPQARVRIRQIRVSLIRNAIHAISAIVDGTRPSRIRAILRDVNTIHVDAQILGPRIEKTAFALEPSFTTKERCLGIGLPFALPIPPKGSA